MRNNTRTIRIVYKDVMYDCEVEQIPTNTHDIDAPFTCRRCDNKLRVVSEAQERHRWEDKYSLIMLCRKCRVAYLYNYTISAIEPMNIENGDNQNVAK